METKIVYVYDKNTKEYLYPREISVGATIENSTEIPVPDGLWGKVKWTGTSWVGQTQEEYINSITPDMLPADAEQKPSASQIAQANTLKTVAELQVAHTGQQKLNAGLMKDNASLKKQNESQAKINADLMKDMATLKKQVATLTTTPAQ